MVCFDTLTDYEKETVEEKMEKKVTAWCDLFCGSGCGPEEPEDLMLQL